MANGKPLILMLMSAELERVHAAMMMAASGAAVGRPVTLFICKSAVTLFKEGGWASAGGAAYDAKLNAQDIADFSLLCEAIRSLSVKTLVCDNALAEWGLTIADINPGLNARAAAMTALLERPSDADWLSF